MAVVKINALQVPEGNEDKVEQAFATHRDAMADTPGFLGFEVLRPVAGEDRWFVYTRWESDEAFQAWRSREPGDAAHAEQRHDPLSSGAGLLEFDVVVSTL